MHLEKRCVSVSVSRCVSFPGETLISAVAAVGAAAFSLFLSWSTVEQANSCSSVGCRPRLGARLLVGVSLLGQCQCFVRPVAVK